MERDYLTCYHSSKEWFEIFSDPKFDQEYYYEGNDLGLTFSEDKSIFKIWAPTSKKVIINLYNTGNELEEKIPFKSQELTYTNRGVWEIEINENLNNKYYTFELETNGKINITNDPYGKSCGVNGKRSMIFNMSETNPENWENNKHIFHQINDIIIYELHINDFSNNNNTTFNPEYKGKFLAFTEENVTLKSDDNIKIGLDYIKNLGITCLQLQPFFDFGSINEDAKNSNNDNNSYNWGYDPLNYNCLEGSYSTNPYDGKIRIKEFKRLVQSVHNKNISLIMDVVYNHTYSFQFSNLNLTVPYYYYRQDKNGFITNGSGCGNEIATERKMVSKYIIDSILFYINEYKIDGFRFDLMGLHDCLFMNNLRNIIDNKIENGKNIIIYGEPWNVCKSNSAKKEYDFNLADKEHVYLLNNGISFFHDELRDAIKGNVFDKYKGGFINGNQKYFQEKIKRYFVGHLYEGINDENCYPNKLINYSSCHDNNTLWDKLVYTLLLKDDFESIKQKYNKEILEKEINFNDEEYNKFKKEYFEKLKLYKSFKERDENLLDQINNEINNLLNDNETYCKNKFYNYVLNKEENRLIMNKKNYFLERNEKLIKINKLAFSFIIFSYGIPFFLAGEEFARTKLGNENSYNSSKIINELDWERITKFNDLVNYYKNCINLRKKLNNFFTLNKTNYSNIKTPEGVISFLLKRNKIGVYKEIIIIFNSNENDFEFTINLKRDWHILLLESKNKYESNKIFKFNEKILISSFSCCIIGNLDV